jgi:hypothetical protein
MFVFSKQKVTVTHINTREEKHGEDQVLACDISIAADLPNTFLDSLSPGLRASLYGRPDMVDLAADQDHLPVLRHSFLGRLSWTQEMTAASVVLHGATKNKDMVMEANIKKLRLDCQDGGTVGVTFTVQSPVTPEDVGRLAGLLSKQIKLSVKPGDAPAGGGTDGGDDDDPAEE